MALQVSRSVNIGQALASLRKFGPQDTTLYAVAYYGSTSADCASTDVGFECGYVGEGDDDLGPNLGESFG
jgi:hypothetical protein